MTRVWFVLIALCPRRVLRVVDRVALCLGLVACGGDAAPPVDAAPDHAGLCQCPTCGDNVWLPCDGGEQ